ncbi:hypothetical protein D3C86_1538070 [compost metagenome]
MRFLNRTHKALDVEGVAYDFLEGPFVRSRSGDVESTGEGGFASKGEPLRPVTRDSGRRRVRLDRLQKSSERLGRAKAIEVRSGEVSQRRQRVAKGI